MTSIPDDALPILSSFAPASTPARLMQALLRLLLRWFPRRSFRFAGSGSHGNRRGG